MSRFYATIKPGTGKQVRRQGHAERGIVAAIDGARFGVAVAAAAHGPRDCFGIYFRPDPANGGHGAITIGHVRECSDGRIVFEPGDDIGGTVHLF